MSSDGPVPLADAPPIAAHVREDHGAPVRMVRRADAPPATAGARNEEESINKSFPLAVQPSVVHFGGYELDKSHKMQLKLINCSGQPFRYVVTPPSTPFFTMRLTKKDVFVPGIPETIELEFKPTEHRYYFDSIAIACESGDKILVPIHAYPVLAEISVPPSLDFGVVPIQTTATRTFSLRSSIPVEFEYRVNTISSSPALTISPPTGKIPANGAATVTVTYLPTDYTTSTLTFEVEVSEFNSKPLRCTASGSCTPGALIEATIRAGRGEREPVPRDSTTRGGRRDRDEKEKRENANSTTPDAGDGNTAVYRAAPPPTRPSQQATRRVRTREPAAEAAAMEVDGIVLPKRLDNMAAINFILNQTRKVEKGPKASLLGPNYFTTHAALQRELLRELKADASRTPTLGEPEMTHEERRAILAARRITEEQYATAKGEGEGARDAALTRTTTVTESGVRVYRLAGTGLPSTPTFAPRLFDTLSQRMEALQRFVAAARTVVLRARLMRRLRQIQAAHAPGRHDEPLTTHTQESLSVRLPPPPGPPPLPLWVTTLMPVHMARAAVVVPTVPPRLAPPIFFEPMVPEYYRTLAYQPLTARDVVSLPTEASRPMRKLTDPIPAPPSRATQQEAARAKTTKPLQPRASDTALAATPRPPTPHERVPSRENISLAVPDALLQPDLPIRALLPHPEISPVPQPLPLGETSEFHLLQPFANILVPHGRLLPTAAATDLAPEGLMVAFESVAVASTLAHQSLSRFWIPRCTDPFADSLPVTCALLPRPAPGAAVTSAPVLPVPPVETVFHLPPADVPSSVDIHIVATASLEPQAMATAPPNTRAPNYAGPLGLLKHDERVAVADAANRAPDSLAARMQRRIDALGSQLPPS